MWWKMAIFCLWKHMQTFNRVQPNYLNAPSFSQYLSQYLRVFSGGFLVLRNTVHSIPIVHMRHVDNGMDGNVHTQASTCLPTLSREEALISWQIMLFFSLKAPPIISWSNCSRQIWSEPGKNASKPDKSLLCREIIIRKVILLADKSRRLGTGFIHISLSIAPSEMQPWWLNKRLVSINTKLSAVQNTHRHAFTHIQKTNHLLSGDKPERKQLLLLIYFQTTHTSERQT